MDFDFSTLIYILFVLVYFLYTTLNKRKNQKARRERDKTAEEGTPTAGPPPADRRPSFEELLEEFTGKRPAYQPQPAPVVTEERPARVPQPLHASEDKPVIFDAKRDRRSMPSRFSKFEEYSQKVQVANEYSKWFEDLDDVKKAFVLSKIINRKY